MLQIVYVSSTTAHGHTDTILDTSRRNNARDGVTGLLYADGGRFLQVLEGPQDMVEAAFARIRQDVRHRAVVILSRRTVEVREFGPWDMAYRRAGQDDDVFAARIDALLADASPSVRATFAGFIEVRRTAA